MTHVSVYAGILAVIYVYLALSVTKHRHRARVGLGTGSDMALQQAVRIHANFAEYVPFALLLVAFLELGGAPLWVVHGLGFVLVAARVLHVTGLRSSPTKSFGRWWGTAGTFVVIALAGLSNVWTGLAAAITTPAL